MPIPAIARVLNEAKNIQSIFKLVDKSPVNPIKDLMAIIINEVPTAFFMGKPANKTKAGMIKKPPPAPTNPVKAPTNKPSIIITG